MKNMFILTAIIGLLVCSCSSNEEVYNNYHKEGNTSFGVTVEHPVCNETRAHLNENYHVVFDEEDKIAVFEHNTAKREYTYSINESKFSGDPSTEEEPIEGEPIEGIYALYPSSAAGSYNSGTLPAEQAYCANSFFNGSQIMYAQTENIEDGFNLKNMCGYIRLHLYGENVSVKEITLTVAGEGEYVSGDFDIVPNEDNGYSLKMKEEGESQQQSVKLVCPEGVELGTTSESATVFYIALPPQTYTKGFSVTITDIFDREFTKTAFSENGFELKRNHIKPMEALKIDNALNQVLKIEKGEDGKQYAKVGKVEDLCKWGYIINNANKTLGMTLEDDIEMPNKVIELDPETKTYKFTDEEITITDGVPSGSNWIPIGTYIGSSDLTKAFKGNIDGQNNSIIGLCINKTGTTGVGLVGEFADGSIRNLTINKSYIYSDGQAVGIVGDNRYNTVIENVHLKNSHIQGNGIVGGIVGYNYRRRQNEGQAHERLSYIINCSTDNNTRIFGSGEYVGGICGYNQSHAIINCVNSADVTGQNLVGGIAGETRTYTSYNVNGYVIASGSTSDAEITATGNSIANAGGIAGRNWRNRDHQPSQSYVIACYSFSTVNSTKTDHKGSLIGSGYGTIHSGHIYSSFAEKNELNSIVGHDQNPEEIFASNHFESAQDITEDFVIQMNNAIETYNNNVNDIQDDAEENIKCHYKWKYNAGEWPTLVPITGESN